MGKIVHVAIFDVTNEFACKNLDEQLEAFRNCLIAANNRFVSIDKQQKNNTKDVFEKTVENCAEALTLEQFKQSYNNSTYIFVAPEFTFTNSATLFLEKNAHGSYTKAYKTKIRDSVLEFSKKVPKMLIVSGSIPYLKESGTEYKNTAFLIKNGHYVSYSKQTLSDREKNPEWAHFVRGKKPGVFYCDPFFLGVEICADVLGNTLLQAVNSVNKHKKNQDFFLDMQVILSDSIAHRKPLKIHNDGILIQADQWGYECKHYNDNRGGVFNKWKQPVGKKSSERVGNEENYYFEHIYVSTRHRPQQKPDKKIMSLFFKNKRSKISGLSIIPQVIAPSSQELQQNKLQRRIEQQILKMKEYLPLATIGGNPKFQHHLQILQQQGELLLCFAPQELAMLLYYEVEITRNIIKSMHRRKDFIKFNWLWLEIFKELHKKNTEEDTQTIREIFNTLVEQDYLQITISEDIISFLEVLPINCSEKLLLNYGYAIKNGYSLTKALSAFDEFVRTNLAVQFLQCYPEKIKDFDQLSYLAENLPENCRILLLKMDEIQDKISTWLEADKLIELLPNEHKREFWEIFNHNNAAKKEFYQYDEGGYKIT